MGQDHICLAAASADDPLSTCLVGIPFKPEEFPAELLRVTVEPEEQEEEEIEMDRMEDDEGRNPDLEDHGLGYPTQHEWFASSYPNSEYLPPPFQFTSS
ncbi:hypothetical protein DUI87_04026 [Hirundo rustica rustica]|uniref:Uncharacterized protein n=1 Tax=Hirundo rustica rustica TaxID=333673 RepID=A0A3M0L2T1_HIRRU|nr:hypothetical protein DUI87_04026 [Hirundo rustica rustica]